MLAHHSILKAALSNRPPSGQQQRGNTESDERFEEGSGTDDEDELQADAVDKANGSSSQERARARIVTSLTALDDDPTSSNKIVVLCAILDEARRLGEKVLVFSQRLRTLDYLEALCESQGRKVYILQGRTVDRQKLVSDFNTDQSAAVFLVSTKAGGTGLNIHGASRVVIFDFKYAPTTEEIQAIARAHRMGQKKPVFVYWLTVATTFEESVQNISIFKKQLFGRAVDQKDEVPWATTRKDVFSLASIPSIRANLNHLRGQDRVLDAILADEAQRRALVNVMTEEDFARGGTSSSSAVVPAAGQGQEDRPRLIGGSSGQSKLEAIVIDD